MEYKEFFEKALSAAETKYPCSDIETALGNITARAESPEQQNGSAGFKHTSAHKSDMKPERSIFPMIGYIAGAAALIFVCGLGVKLAIDNGGLVEGGPQAADTSVTTGVTTAEEITTSETSAEPTVDEITPRMEAAWKLGNDYMHELLFSMTDDEVKDTMRASCGKEPASETVFEAPVGAEEPRMYIYDDMPFFGYNAGMGAVVSDSRGLTQVDYTIEAKSDQDTKAVYEELNDKLTEMLGQPDSSDDTYSSWDVMEAGICFSLREADDHHVKFFMYNKYMSAEKDEDITTTAEEETEAVETTTDISADMTADTTAPITEDDVTETTPADEPTAEELLSYLSQGPEVWGYSFTISDVNRAGLMMHFKRDPSVKWADKYIISAGDFIIETLDEGGDWVTYEPELQKKWGYPDWLLEYDTVDITGDDIPAQFYGADELGGNELPNGRYRIRLPIAAVIGEDFPTSRRDPFVRGSAYAEFDITDETPNVFGMSFKVTNVTSGSVTIEVKQDKSEFGTEWYHALSYQAKLGYLPAYHVQQYVGGKWETLGTKNMMMPSWASTIYPVESDGTTVMSVNFSELYGELANGKYRIVKTFLNYSGSDDYNSASVLNEKTCYIEFNVTDGETHWGITLEAKDATATGMTLVINEWGGRYSGEVTYGTSFGIERFENDEWTTVPDISDNYGWTLIAYSLPRNSVTEEKENWGYHLGALPPGKYRISKGFSDGDYRNTKTFYAEFELTEETGSKLGVSMLRNNNTANDIELLVIQHGCTVEGDITYAPSFTIERDNDGKWEELPTQSGMPAVWNTPATLPVLPRDEENATITTITASWEIIYGTLPPGKYRICKTFRCGDITETVYAVFTVTSQE